MRLLVGNIEVGGLRSLQVSYPGDRELRVDCAYLENDVGQNSLWDAHCESERCFFDSGAYKMWGVITSISMGQGQISFHICEVAEPPIKVHMDVNADGLMDGLRAIGTCVEGAKVAKVHVHDVGAVPMTPYIPRASTCECGATACGSLRHSTYCPMHSKEKI